MKAEHKTWQNHYFFMCDSYYYDSAHFFCYFVFTTRREIECFFR